MLGIGSPPGHRQASCFVCRCTGEHCEHWLSMEVSACCHPSTREGWLTCCVLQHLRLMWCWMHLGTLQLDVSKLVPLQVSLLVHPLMPLLKNPVCVCSETLKVDGTIALLCAAPAGGTLCTIDVAEDSCLCGAGSPPAGLCWDYARLCRWCCEWRTVL